ncbi:hypothetical protein D9758_016112 [Tetrapyrgos nigripes]|uniref:F-box domain-containing protein n=1 Tax=Tetrapyrgos nigripes TaxID=182062 RepID=A0A8H5BZQ7_9AGAR|nr:hypothetical protein D9758_016112 [Tetrapyrgos nigripes]
MTRSARLQHHPKAAGESNSTQLNEQSTTTAPRSSKRAQDDETARVGERSKEVFSDEAEYSVFGGKRKRGHGGNSQKKRTKIVAADEKFRGKLGPLQKLVTEVPLDVVFETFSHLEPLDILRLSRTSLVLRNLLTTRSSGHVWRNARLNVAYLPPPPPDLNEIQYAHLCFDMLCSVCGLDCDHVCWDVYLRFCKSCVDNVYVWFAAAHLLDFRSLIQCDVWQMWHVRQQINRIRESKDKRRQVLKDIRRQRKEDIEARLTTLGWGPEMKRLKDRGEDILDAKSVKQPVKLTERAWQMISPGFVKILQAERAARLTEKERCQVLTTSDTQLFKSPTQSTS